MTGSWLQGFALFELSDKHYIFLFMQNAYVYIPNNFHKSMASESQNDTSQARRARILIFLPLIHNVCDSFKETHISQASPGFYWCCF